MITLSSLLTQIFLYSNKLENKETFLKSCRISEIVRAIEAYTESYDTTKAISVLTLMRTDLKLLESA